MSIDGKYAVPTVAVHTDIFYPVTQSVVRMNGMPRMRMDSNGDASDGCQ